LSFRRRRQRLTLIFRCQNHCGCSLPLSSLPLI
jgi:hypothetical protein